MTLDPKHLIFKEWSGEHFRPINQFYKKQKHKGSASRNERVFIIEYDNYIIAAVRLVPYENYYWLRSLYVEQSKQGQSLGSQLLIFVHQHINQAIYCFPYLHLEHFYQKAGYELISEDQMPQSIHQLFSRYRRKGQSILSMGKNITL